MREGKRERERKGRRPWFSRVVSCQEGDAGTGSRSTSQHWAVVPVAVPPDCVPDQTDGTLRCLWRQTHISVQTAAGYSFTYCTWCMGIFVLYREEGSFTSSLRWFVSSFLCFFFT